MQRRPRGSPVRRLLRSVAPLLHSTRDDDDFYSTGNRQFTLSRREPFKSHSSYTLSAPPVSTTWWSKQNDLLAVPLRHVVGVSIMSEGFTFGPGG